jgi:hypothetical protein
LSMDSPVSPTVPARVPPSFRAAASWPRLEGWPKLSVLASFVVRDAPAARLGMRMAGDIRILHVNPPVPALTRPDAATM